MKKALAMALGAVLVAGSAAPASAASQVDFSGFYGVHYAVNGNLGYTSDNNLNESFFENRFQVNVTFRATDEVTVFWRFRAPRGARWNSTSNDAAIGQRAMSSHYFYGQVVQDWGTVRVGRLSNGLGSRFGLVNLGWAPALDDEFTSISPFDSAAEADSIQYSNTWDNGFSLVTTYTKMTDGYFNDAWTESIGSDHDSDRFQIQGAYQWETGGASLNVMYLRNASANAGARSSFDTNDNLVIVRPVDENEDKTTTWFINPAFVQSWGAFSVHAEAMFATGTTEYYNDGVGADKADTDVSGEGFYLDFDYNYGPGRVNLAGWWVSGNDVEDTDNDNNAAVDIVQGFFYPLVVAYGPAYGNSYYAGPSYHANRGEGAVGVANSADFLASGTENLLSVGNTALADWTALETALNFETGGADFLTYYGNRHDSIDGENGQANHWALMVSGQHAFTDEITFNYALGYLALTNPNYRALDSITVRGDEVTGYGFHTQDKDLGWEIDLGVNVQLLDNLAFTSTVGYMFTGDAYKELKGYRVTGENTLDDYNVRAVWEDADDAYSWLNSLTFSF